jgi:hypothetical protein
VLRRAAAYLSQANPAVAVTCRVLQLPHQPCCRWLADPFGGRELDEAYLANAVLDAHADL